MKPLIQLAFDSLPDSTPYPTQQWFIDVRWAFCADACQKFIKIHLNNIDKEIIKYIEYEKLLNRPYNIPKTPSLFNFNEYVYHDFRRIFKINGIDYYRENELWRRITEPCSEDDEEYYDAN